MKKMLDNLSSVGDDPVIYTAYIRFSAEQKNVDKLQEVLHLMQQKNITLDLDTYYALLRIYCYLDDDEMIESLLPVIRSANSKMSIKIYRLLINHWAKKLDSTRV